MTDKWIPRLYIFAQVAVVVICGVMICLGEDTVVTDLFLAAGGGLIFTQGYRTVTALASKPQKPQE